MNNRRCDRILKRKTKLESIDPYPPQKMPCLTHAMAEKLHRVRISTDNELDSNLFFMKKPELSFAELEAMAAKENSEEVSTAEQCPTDDKAVEYSPELTAFLKESHALLQSTSASDLGYLFPQPCMDLVLWQPKVPWIYPSNTDAKENPADDNQNAESTNSEDDFNLEPMEVVKDVVFKSSSSENLQLLS